MLPKFEPMLQKRQELEASPGKLDEVLNEGARKARKIAQETLKEVRDTMGLLS